MYTQVVIAWNSKASKQTDQGFLLFITWLYFLKLIHRSFLIIEKILLKNLFLKNGPEQQYFLLLAWARHTEGLTVSLKL